MGRRPPGAGTSSGDHNHNHNGNGNGNDDHEGGRGPDRRPDELVWYVAYGSNVDRSRLLTYLAGDRHLGEGSTHDGARDRRPPVTDSAHPLALDVYFAGRSSRWDGAVAYCDHHPASDPALGRRWLLRRSQVEDLVRQENRHAAPVQLDLDRCRRHGHLDVLGGRYGRVVWLGEVDGAPAVTATCARPTAPEGPAGVAYLRTIARGLAECWGLDATQAARYLATRRGNAGRLDPGALAEALRTGDG